jgi:Family of unknown function (DUF6455)
MLVVASREHQPSNIGRMMAHLGIDPGGSVLPRPGLLYATALQRCGACPSKKACREWLNQSVAEVNSPPRFCPSADIFFELQFNQTRTSPRPLLQKGINAPDERSDDAREAS